ncbi:unspecified integral membrane protein [Blumeria hordei DH14]|uniref:Unspecified integral membrane protein n=1 Tax=Blumeria graminis f. sp. hordei (strain DH14) TaxID=546991 RepID=N1JJ28_BLUG1|nr:unspecified integral membrane protein [Blumeria hordei DH14]
MNEEMKSVANRYSGKKLSTATRVNPHDIIIMGFNLATCNSSHICFFISLLLILVIPTSAAFVEFRNCLLQNTIHDEPLALQLVPKFVNIFLNNSNPDHNLNVTVWFNVTGSTAGTEPKLSLPPASNTSYWNSNDTGMGGKIEAVPLSETVNKQTTLENKLNILNYQLVDEYLPFCDIIVNGFCPLGPIFGTNNTRNPSPSEFPSFGFSRYLRSTYAFTTLTATFKVRYGDTQATEIGCVSVNITPEIGFRINYVLKYLPGLILASVGFATSLAAIWSPWGTIDIFRSSTNFGHDLNLLRLVTPSFGDCLQYVQFVALTGGLTIDYPGYYQPIVSKLAWSTLLFNHSFTGEKPKPNSLVDGIYVTHRGYGMDKFSQYIGIGKSEDIWTGMTVWLLAIIAGGLTITQTGFAFRWLKRKLKKEQEEDLRPKNFPFSLGNIIRIVFNYFLLPIVALSMFQLAVALRSQAYIVALAVLMLVLVIGFAIWILKFILSARPKSFLFDDLFTLLIYGSLYNTYREDAASFALIPTVLAFIRGIAIGALQFSGISQLIILAICELIFTLTILVFLPFHSRTSMNAYHTYFSIAKLATILLMFSFVPSLNLDEQQKGWVGYLILVIHAAIMILGFFAKALYITVDVVARYRGVRSSGGLAEVFGMRQLSRRLTRRNDTSRQSQLSSAMMLTSDKKFSDTLGNRRMRSQSGGSIGVLLAGQSSGVDTNMDPFGAMPPHQLEISHTLGPTGPRETQILTLPSVPESSGATHTRVPIIGLDTSEITDPYYRPPRVRRSTLENFPPGAKSRESWGSDNVVCRHPLEHISSNDVQTIEDPTNPVRDGPASAPDEENETQVKTKADYTTREVDLYYRARGPASNNNVSSKRVKNGPADPTKPASSISGWLKWLVGRKTKEKGKGFEIVRSSRMPPSAINDKNSQEEIPMDSISPAIDDQTYNSTGIVEDDVNSSREHRSPLTPDLTNDAIGQEIDSPVNKVLTDTCPPAMAPKISSLELSGSGLDLLGITRSVSSHAISKSKNQIAESTLRSIASQNQLNNSNSQTKDPSGTA